MSQKLSGITCLTLEDQYAHSVRHLSPADRQVVEDLAQPLVSGSEKLISARILWTRLQASRRSMWPEDAAPPAKMDQGPLRHHQV